MKKHRKQLVNVFGEKRMVDVPVDSKLYKADNHAEYQRARSKTKHVSLDEIILVDFTADVTEAYEENQLLERLRETLQTLSKEERQLLECPPSGTLTVTARWDADLIIHTLLVYEEILQGAAAYDKAFTYEGVTKYYSSSMRH